MVQPSSAAKGAASWRRFVLTLLAVAECVPRDDGCAACLASASRTRVLVPPIVCAPGAPSTLRLVAFTRDGQRVTAGGDVFTAALCESAECDEGEVFALRVEDRCDGTYRVLLPCAALLAGTRTLLVELGSAHRRDSLPPRLWFCPNRTATFTAWDSLSYDDLRDRLFNCTSERAPARLVLIGGTGAARAGKPLGPAAACAPSFARAAAPPTPASPAVAQSVLVPCALSTAAERAMLFEPAAFHHCLAAGEDGCTLAHLATPPACLRGERVAFLGDSVVEGTHFDVHHMWAHAQREPDGRPVDKLGQGYCAFDRRGHKWVHRVRKFMKESVNVSACEEEAANAAQGSQPCGWFDPADCEVTTEGRLSNGIAKGTPRPAQPEARGQARRSPGEHGKRQEAGGTLDGPGQHECSRERVQFTFGDYRQPFRQGLRNFERHWDRLQAHLGNHSIVVLESGRHDLANYAYAREGASKPRVLMTYRSLAQTVAQRIRAELTRRSLRVRVLFRTMLPPPTFGTCAITSNLAPVVAIANAAAAHAFASEGFEVLPLHEWGLGTHHPRWWPTAVYSDNSRENASSTRVRDVHMHEDWCPRARLESATTPAVEQLGHRYGWLSKSLTQLSVHALCWPRGTLRRSWEGVRMPLATRKVGPSLGGRAAWPVPRVKLKPTAAVRANKATAS